MAKINIKRKLTTALELPKDVMLGLPIITMTGDEEITITNHKGLVEYSAGCVRLSTPLGGLKIFGINLILKEITAETVMIAGKIASVSWEVK
ncbi:MAG: sporulation protein YqfC [Defluviitaleaceae bacterium]|nr:sporulation protein YqfC [Defluviitaleaceae bacterium]